jgi:hypothetical protein
LAAVGDGWSKLAKVINAGIAAIVKAAGGR